MGDEVEVSGETNETSEKVSVPASAGSDKTMAVSKKLASTVLFIM